MSYLKTKNTLVFFSLFFFLLFLFSTKQGPLPYFFKKLGEPTPSASRSPSDTKKAEALLADFIKTIHDPKLFNPSTAESVVERFTQQAYELSGEDLMPTQNSAEDNTNSKEAFVQRAQVLLKQVYELRGFLREKQKDFESKWLAGEVKEKLVAFRRAQLYLRYTEDTIIQRWDFISPLKRSGKYFGGDFPLTITTDNKKIDYKAGDVFVVRGASFISATIARSLDVPSNLSHLAMIAETESGELRVVESLLETGVIDYPLDHYLDFEPLPRVALYRYKDAKIAREAALELWKIRNEAVAKNTPFDLRMNVDEHSEIYCSEAVMMAYESAFKKLNLKEKNLPLHRSSFYEIVKTKLFKDMDMASMTTSFAPADMDYDTRFSLIAEHRDLDLLSRSRRFDVTMSYLFKKFKRGDFYYGDPFSDTFATIGYLARRLGFLKDTVPGVMGYSALLAMNQHKTNVDYLVEYLDQKETEKEKQLGRPLSYREVEILLEERCEPNKCAMRPEDVQGYIKND